MTEIQGVHGGNWVNPGNGRPSVYKTLHTIASNAPSQSDAKRMVSAIKANQKLHGEEPQGKRQIEEDLINLGWMIARTAQGTKYIAPNVADVTHSEPQQ